jgi:hypothetical protein
MVHRPDEVLMEIEIGGLTFTPGTYRSGSAINFAYGTTVALDAQGNSDGIFLFQAGTTLVTAADTYFKLINGARAENIIWALGSAATLGARSTAEGSIVSGTAITFGTGSNLHGCALAQSVVTFESNGSTQALEYDEGEDKNSVVTSCARSTFRPTSACVETVSHGVCQNFAVHARTTVTFDGVQSTINGGDVGVSPGTSITGEVNIVDGQKLTRSSNKVFADSVLVTYNAAMVHRQDEIMMEIEMGGLTFTPGTYRSLEYVEGEGDYSAVTSCARSAFQPTPACVESVSHGICGSFAVHARTAVSFDGVKSTINGGNVGVSPGTAITSSYDIVHGQKYSWTSSKKFAESVLVAYSFAMRVRDDEVDRAMEMGGLTFTPGTYRSGSQINFAHGTTVTLDAEGDGDAQFLFQAGTTLITAADTSFNLVNELNLGKW